MSKEIATYILLVGLGLSLLALGSSVRTYHLVDNQEGYEPEQPIAFSHRLHAGELAINCEYCHFGAEQSRHAGIPAADICMNCHKFVKATAGALKAEDSKAAEESRTPQPVVSDELAKIYTALGLGDDLERDAAKALTPVEWIKVHNLPDYVYFDHRAHITVGVSCQKCHGNIEAMERVRQVENLSMGWCINCHRQANDIGVLGKPVNASTDCTTCHY